MEAFDARVSAAKVVSRVTAEPASDALSMYSLLCNVENLIVTPPVPHLSIGMHQGASLAPLGRHKGPLNLFYLRENT